MDGGIEGNEIGKLDIAVAFDIAREGSRDACADQSGRAAEHIGPAHEPEGLDSRMSRRASNATPINPESQLATERASIPPILQTTDTKNRI